MTFRPDDLDELKAVKDAVFAAGVCPECRLRFHAKNRSTCSVCLEKARVRARERIAFKGKKSCGICHHAGHDRRTCPQRRAA